MHAGRASGALLLALLVAAAPAAAQEPGTATFHITDRAGAVGTASATLAREGEGWRLTGISDMPGLRLAVRQLEVHYDPLWRPRHLTMEMSSPDDDAIVHVAFGLAGGETRTDIVRASGAVYGANKVSPDTLPLPDFVFSAYEALAGRLATASPGTELHAFVVPRFEVPVAVERVEDESVATRSGRLAARHWHLRFLRADGAAVVDLWSADGRLIRIDFEKDGLRVVRDDVVIQ